jgi:acyl-CoA ligase (AMP-forming) (exosortase A-associated)
VTALFHELIDRATDRAPTAIALRHRQLICNYAQLHAACMQFGSGLIALGLARHDRVAVYLPKQLETVAALFGTSRAGGVFVPINPVLKAAQVRHILRDCNVRVLVTSPERLAALAEVLGECPDLRHVVLVGPPAVRLATIPPSIREHQWDALNGAQNPTHYHRVIDADMAAILYTSGSTGSPKGVVLSHRNLLTGAQSVAHYLGNNASDRLLAVLPLSFDYGLSQLSTAFHVGASVVLLEHLFARDVIAAVVAEQITGLAAVPPLWTQLAELSWPSQSALRYITNSGGAMPSATLQRLRTQLPTTQVFLMYGLTEAFRSTFLPPSEIDRRPSSIGKAIPNAEVLVVRPDGSECVPNESGELVHRGSLVAMGYWNAPELTAQRFRAAPGRHAELSIPDIAVWSGDTVRRDEDGYLYFIGRQDEMIKTSGYRVSPTEIEDVILRSALAIEAVAFGIPHATLGQAIAVFAVPRSDSQQDTQALLDGCRVNLPAFMVPLHIAWRSSLPRNPNGKYDRKRLAAEIIAQLDPTQPKSAL